MDWVQLLHKRNSMKLTVELIAGTGGCSHTFHATASFELTLLHADSFLNPLKDRELDLRGG